MGYVKELRNFFGYTEIFLVLVIITCSVYKITFEGSHCFLFKIKTMKEGKEPKKGEMRKEYF